MRPLYQLIWNHKNTLLLVTLSLMCLCLSQLKELKVFFESERIIEEISKNKFDTDFKPSHINDENIFFVILKSDSTLQYEHAKYLNDRITKVKKLSSVRQVLSLFNEKTIKSPSIIPIPRNKLKLKSQSSFETSIDTQSKFLSDDLKSTFFLVETHNINRMQSEDLILEIQNIFSNEKTRITFAGRVPSEIYFQKNVLQEFIYLSIISCILCLIIMYIFTKNLKLVLVSLVCVLSTIILCLSLSQLLFGGIELFMIISPAIIFIVTVSDIMHLVNNQNENPINKEELFMSQMKKIGVPVLITSVTTMISFFTFILIDITPLSRFGFITGVGVIFALFLSVLAFSFAVEYKFSDSKSFDLVDKILSKTIHSFKSKFNHYFLATLTCLFISVVYVGSVNVDNYLLDELNEKSDFYQQSKFFDENFGGIKPFTMVIEAENSKQLDKVKFREFLEENNIDIDLSNDSKINKQIFNYLFKEKTNDLIFSCRVPDLGSKNSKDLYNKIQGFDKNINVQFFGIGYLFDITSDALTKNLIYGMMIAILSVGIIFFLIYGFKLKYFLLGIVPNILPLVMTIGIITFCSNFYLSLSNAFIFTVAFGLIIDDSIHIINSYIFSIKSGKTNNKSIAYVQQKTGRAIIKTTIIVLFCLLPLLVSQFKSVSQLSLITTISAAIALIFDLALLPRFLSRIRL